MNDEKTLHLLVVDDDNRLRRLLHQYLSENGFVIAEAASAAEAREQMENFSFDLMILDVMMPNETGLEFAKSLRNAGNIIPILMLTAMGDLQDRINGLESGVDDYLSKPFDPKELLLRINSILRRSLPSIQKEKENKLVFGACSYDVVRGVLSKADDYIPLTAVEAELMRVLVANVGKEITREELARQTNTENERTIDVQINRLRKKIEVDLKNPRYIQTIRGKGYICLPDK